MEVMVVTRRDGVAEGVAQVGIYFVEGLGGYGGVVGVGGGSS